MTKKERELLEDLHDLADAKKAQADMERNGEKPVPWEQVKKDLGLDG